MSFLTKFFPKVEAQEEEPPEEEDLVDPQQELREKCAQTSHAQALHKKLEECNNRVNSRSKTTETCVEELFDYLHAIDHCVTKDLFSKLK